VVNVDNLVGSVTKANHLAGGGGSDGCAVGSRRRVMSLPPYGCVALDGALGGDSSPSNPYPICSVHWENAIPICGRLRYHEDDGVATQVGFEDKNDNWLETAPCLPDLSTELLAPPLDCKLFHVIRLVTIDNPRSEPENARPTGLFIRVSPYV